MIVAADYDQLARWLLEDHAVGNITLEEIAPLHAAVAKIAAELRHRDPDYLLRFKVGLAASQSKWKRTVAR